MRMDKLTESFNKFAGREVGMIEKDIKIDVGGTIYEWTEPHMKDGDPVIAEMNAEAKKLGLRLRVWTPGSMGTMDYDERRMNAYIEKNNDGKYRVTRQFGLG